MAVTAPRRRTRSRWVLPGLVVVVGAGLAPVFLLVVVLGALHHSGGCTGVGGGPVGGGPGPSGGVSLRAPGSSGVVGATEYGGPGDPSSGTVGSSGVDLSTHPDSYAELGGTGFATATALGGLPYETPLRVSWDGHTVIAYKRDIGLGGGPVDGRPREIDLWWGLAAALGIPYEDGLWSGTVHLLHPPATGAAALLHESVAAVAPAPDPSSPVAGSGCPSPPGLPIVTPVAPGDRARLLPDGLAAAPAEAPAAVKGIIAAGNQIVGKPYVYGGGHGIPLDQVAPSYDCSSSVEHLLWGGGLLGVDYDADSSTLESWGDPGPGRWVTIEASADHVFMYVAGLRWDTHDAAGPGDGTTGIGWHPLIREDDGFVARHPAGL